jgi:hypothetical protein
MKQVPENAVAWLNNCEVYATNDSLFIDGKEYKMFSPRVYDPVKMVMKAAAQSDSYDFILRLIKEGHYKAKE